MVHYHNFEQLSDEWFSFKSGKMSASNATPIGANGAGLKTYSMELAMQKNGVDKDSFSNSDTERGIELEPLAVTTYELEYGVQVFPMGCISNDLYKNVCVSPDGLIGNDGGTEIKARNNTKHYALIQGITKDIPFNQIQMTLLVSERKWWDFVSFNPNFSKPLFVKRIFPDLEYFDKLKKGFDTGNKLINEYVESYNKYESPIFQIK